VPLFWTSKATFSDVGVGVPLLSAAAVDPSAEIFNRIQIAATGEDTAGALAVLWTRTGGTNPVLKPNQSMTFTAKYTVPAAGGYVNPWTTPVVGTDVTATPDNTNLTITNVIQRSTEMQFTVNNTDRKYSKTLALVRARGIPYARAVPAIIITEDAASIATYGQREYTMPAGWLPQFADAQNLCDWFLAEHKDPRPRLIISFVASRSDAAMTQALLRCVGDRITVILNQGGWNLQADYYIENIHHAISNGKTLHIVTYELADAPADWVLPYGALGETTLLQYEDA
jgi:hypothetical protein